MISNLWKIFTADVSGVDVQKTYREIWYRDCWR